MLISESMAQAIIDALNKKFSVVPIITVQQIQAISFKFMDPLLILMELVLDGTENSKDIFKNLLFLLKAQYPNESKSLESSLGEEANPDVFLQEGIKKILRQHMVQSFVETKEDAELPEVYAELYPILYKLLHVYRLNKSADRSDIDYINFIRLMTGQPMLTKFGTFSKNISKNTGVEIPAHEIKFVVELCFTLKIQQLDLVSFEKSSDVQDALMIASGLGFVEVIDCLIKKKRTLIC